MRNNDPAKEWGLPDWQDRNSYGDTSDWDLYKWRWEFLRRRQDVREYFDEHARAHHNHLSKAYREAQEMDSGATSDVSNADSPSPNQRGFSIPEPTSLLPLNGVPNPRISNQPSWLLYQISCDYYKIEYYPGNYYEEGKFLELDSCQIAVVFDLDKPLTDQLEQAKNLLTPSQKARHGKKISSRSHKDKWLTYLQLLDATECGAQVGKLEKLCKDKRETPQAIYETLKAAKNTRDNF